MAVERKFINEALKRVKISEYVRMQLDRIGCGKIEVKRTPLGTRVIIHATKPGLVIGRKGKNIQMLTANLKGKFGIDNPQIEVQEIVSSYLDARIMAKQLALSLERGIHFRRASYQTIRSIMTAGALGAQIEITGKMSGSRARNEKFKQGFIKHCGETSEHIDFGIAEAILKAGKVGVKVKITPPGENLFKDLIYKEAEAPEVKTTEELETAEEKTAEPVVEEAAKPKPKEKPVKKEEKKEKKPAVKKAVKKPAKKEEKKEKKPAAKKPVKKTTAKAAAAKKKVTKNGSDKKE